MNQDESLRDHVLSLLRGGRAHLNFDAAVADLSPDLRGARPAGLVHSPWRLVEHLRIAQWDILEFCCNSDHHSPEFPEGYWPPNDAPPDAAAWDRALDQFRADLHSLEELLASPSTNLFAPLAYGDGQTILREALLVADHNAYHLGQLVVVRRTLGAWPSSA